MNGNEPIQPIYTASGSPCDESDIVYLDGRKTFKGLTKREYFAAMAMQGLLHDREYSIAVSAAELTKASVEYADALIAQLNTTATQP